MHAVPFPKSCFCSFTLSRSLDALVRETSCGKGKNSKRSAASSTSGCGHPLISQSSRAQTTLRRIISQYKALGITDGKNVVASWPQYDAFWATFATTISEAHSCTPSRTLQWCRWRAWNSHSSKRLKSPSEREFTSRSKSLEPLGRSFFASWRRSLRSKSIVSLVATR